MAERKQRNTAQKKTGKRTQGNSSKGKREVNGSPYREEVILVVTLVIAILITLSYFNLCSIFGRGVNFVLFGLFGFAAYLVPVLLFFGVAFAISNKGILSAKIKMISSGVLYLVLAGMIHLVVHGKDTSKISDMFIESAKMRSGGGFVGGGLSKALCFVFGEVGTYIVYIGIAAILIMLITEKFLFAGLKEQRKKSAIKRAQKRTEVTKEEPSLSKRKPAKVFTFSKEDRENIKQVDSKQTESEKEAESKKAEPKKVEPSKMENMDVDIENLSILRGYEKKETIEKEEIPIFEEELNQKFGKEEPILEKEKEASTKEIPIVEESKENVEEAIVSDNEKVEEKEEQNIPDEKVEMENCKEETKIDKKKNAPTKAEQQAVSAEIGQALQKKKKHYVFPSLDLLSKAKNDGKSTSDTELRDTALKLKTTLESFGVKVDMKNVSCGPTVTRYELQPAQGVKVSKITSLTDDIKLSLAAADIRIEAPIPGKSAVGIEVPNKVVSMVHLRSLLETNEFKKHKSNLSFAVGKDIGGKTVVTDIAKMPHLLIAGATGSGKSVCINTLIMSILYKANPEDVKLIMVDPKVVELSVYNGIPHLLIPVVTDPKKASGALNWAVVEMTERYKKFADLGVRDIKGYNEKVKVVEEENDERFQKMPQIVIIVDELADLMMVAPGEVEDAICRLAQLARAAGIHLIIATQRPSVNVITGLIKANIPSRVAFAVSSAVDSRTILDGGGAEKLLGNGDMLFFPSGYPKPIRVQGSYVSDKEVSAVVDFLKDEYGNTEYSDEIDEKITSSVTSNSAQAGAKNERDEYFVEAGRFVIAKDKASIGMLQRVYKIGFNRAARIMDQLYDAGVVGPEEGTKPRKVVMSDEEFEHYIEEFV